MPVTETVSDIILRDEIKRLEALLVARETEICRLREDARVSAFRTMTFVETEAHVAAALSLALENICEQSYGGPRAKFWINRALGEMGIDTTDPEEDLREHYRPQREALAYKAQQEEFEAAERFNAWRRQPMAAE